MPLFKLHDSIAAKLVLGYGLLGMASMAAVSAVFYFGTIGVLDRDVDSKLVAQSERLVQRSAGQPAALDALADTVRQQLSDGIDSEREIYLLLDARRQAVAGNLARWPDLAPGLASADVTRAGQRAGQRIDARLYARRLPAGGLLLVGRDQEEQQAIRSVVGRALAAGAAVSLLLTVAGALLFRRQVEGRLGAIRRTAAQIETGDLSPRVPVSGNDEFALLSGDINRMLDRIERLMDGVRHVSDAIAHDLRTPLGRIRSKLDDALRHGPTGDTLGSAAHDAIDDIDELIRLFERLLQIAEAESGMRPHTFERLDLRRIAADIAEMYEASAEDGGIVLAVERGAAVAVDGDRNLLASAIASLLDNALKYAGAGAAVTLRAGIAGTQAWIAVCDNGPGIPAGELGRVTQRFYRLDQSRHLPGNGLGLAIVSATAVLHGGALALEDGAPGLVARLLLPAQLSNL